MFPASDRRRRQNWIDAIAGVNPPLLQLLEASPAAEEVELVAKPSAPAATTKKRVQNPIAPVVKTQKPAHKPIQEVQAQELIELALDEKLPSEEEARSIVSHYFISTALRKIRNASPTRVFFPGQYVRIIEVLGCRNSQFCGSIGIVVEHYFNVWVWVDLDGGGRKIIICRPEELELVELVVAEKQEAIGPAVKTSPGVDVDQVSEPKSIAHELLQLFKSSVRIEEPIIETVKNSPGVEVDTAH